MVERGGGSGGPGGGGMGAPYEERQRVVRKHKQMAAAADDDRGDIVEIHQRHTGAMLSLHSPHCARYKLPDCWYAHYSQIGCSTPQVMDRLFGSSLVSTRVEWHPIRILAI